MKKLLLTTAMFIGLGATAQAETTQEYLNRPSIELEISIGKLPAALVGGVVSISLLPYVSIAGAIVGSTTVFAASPALNHIFGGEDCKTLTQEAYESKQRGEMRGIVEDAAYSVAFFGFDTGAALAMGKPEAIGSHGEVTELYIDDLLTWCEVKENYGGANYVEFMNKRKN